MSLVSGLVGVKLIYDFAKNVVIFIA
uniref:Uncharacterized protein n=1 Tax=Anguilla anguilla TaxID=7936 RepID=A0A0E9U7D1_ANGAN